MRETETKIVLGCGGWEAGNFGETADDINKWRTKD